MMGESIYMIAWYLCLGFKFIHVDIFNPSIYHHCVILGFFSPFFFFFAYNSAQRSAQYLDHTLTPLWKQILTIFFQVGGGGGGDVSESLPPPPPPPPHPPTEWLFQDWQQGIKPFSAILPPLTKHLAPGLGSALGSCNGTMKITLLYISRFKK